MKRQRLGHYALLPLILLLASCSNKTESATSDMPHAVVTMRDGTTVSGTVVSTTPTGITLNPDAGGTRDIPMKEVKSITYGDDTSPATAGPKTANSAAAQPEANRVHPGREAIKTKTFEVPLGTELSVRSDETIDSATAAEGQSYAGEITNDVKDAAGDVVIPRGANAQLVIKSASKGGRFQGTSDLVIDLQSVSVGGQQYLVNTTDFVEQGRSGIGANKRTGEYVGGGAGIGTLIGAIAGHGKGAAIGAAAGAGAGAAAQIMTKGGSIQIPAETVMTFKLEKTLRVAERR
jgi:hypothetical protein